MIPRWTFRVLFFFLLMSGTCSLWWALAARGSAEPSQIDPRQGKPFVEAVDVADDGAGLAAFSIEERHVEEPRAARSKTLTTMHRGAAAVLAEEIELRALGEAQALSLTAEQWARFAGVTLDHQAIRHAYEAEVAVVTESGQGRQRLEIPAYVEADAALRSEFYKTLLSELGDLVAEEIVRKLSPELESRFAGFGAAAQTLEFSDLMPGNAEGGVVTRTTRYWDEATGGDASRMRRETFFPRMEDPDGLQWGPLLARLERALSKKVRG